MNFACILGHKPDLRTGQQPEADGNDGFVLWTHCERCGKQMEYRHRNLWEQWRAAQ